MIAFALAFAVPFLLSLAFTPLTGVLGRRLGVVDAPGGRRRHRGVVSRLGGIALYLSFVIGVLVLLALPAAWQPLRQDPNESIRLTGLLLGSTVIFALGLLDDFIHLKPAIQFAGQFVVAVIACLHLIFIERVNNPFTNDLIIFPILLTWIISIFWITGMINTVNFLDGVDGLAAGVTAIICAFLTIHMIRMGQLSVSLLPLALFGAVLGFLPFNFSPARVFMGGGAYFLGFAVGALSIMAGAKVATVLLAMGIPIMDVAWQILSRLRAGSSPGQADRGHLHHRLQDLGYSPRQIVFFYCSFCILFGVLALVIENRLYKVVALGILALVTVAILIAVSRKGDKGAPHEA